MALDLPSHLLDEGLMSKIRASKEYVFDGFSEKNGEDCHGMSWISKGGFNDSFSYGMSGFGRSGYCQDPVSDDILDVLPSDPFGMDMSTTVSALAGWLEEAFNVDCCGYEHGVGVGASNGDDNDGDDEEELFVGWDYIWNNGELAFDCESTESGDFSGSGCACHDGFEAVGEFDDDLYEGNGFPGVGCRSIGEYVECLELDDGGLEIGFYGFSEINEADNGGLPCRWKEVKSSDCFWCGEVSGNSYVEDDASCSDICQSVLGTGNVSVDNNGTARITCCKHSECVEGAAWSCPDADAGAPHAALFFSLTHLSVKDLLVVERVCRSLCHTVQNDPLLWRSIHIEQPLSEKITNDVLLELTNRAQGKLSCLSLVECTRITDVGLKRVLETNPGLTKLSVPGCTRLSIEGIIENIRALKSMEKLKLKHLRVGGLYGVKQEHIEELKILLGVETEIEKHHHKPRYYNRENLYLSCEDQRSIDIEVCPKCENMRLVYDCPTDVCQGKVNTAQECRACILCIIRCVQCGRCIHDNEYEETFCLDLLCSYCSSEPLSRSEYQRNREVEKNVNFSYSG